MVALGEGAHGNEEGHAFRLALLRDRRFTSTVNDILVEFGSGRYQQLMDRFVRGEEVSRDELRHVWHTIWSQWLPESGYEAVESPDFERYDATFEPRAGSGRVELWVPIRR